MWALHWSERRKSEYVLGLESGTSLHEKESSQWTKVGLGRNKRFKITPYYSRSIIRSVHIHVYGVDIKTGTFTTVLVIVVLICNRNLCTLSCSIYT